MSTYHPKRRTKEERQAATNAMLNKPCKCSHHNALTCSSEMHNTTRFNALIVYGNCSCRCHRSHDNQPLSQSDWECVKARQGEVVSA